jgi:hypothetical protein
MVNLDQCRDGMTLLKVSIRQIMVKIVLMVVMMARWQFDVVSCEFLQLTHPVWGLGWYPVVQWVT